MHFDNFFLCNLYSLLYDVALAVDIYLSVIFIEWT